VLRVGEQAHPREHIAHLGPLEEGLVRLAARLRGQGVAGARLSALGRLRRDPGSGHHPRIRAYPRRGYSVTEHRYSGEPAPRGYALGMDVIDWRTAQRIGERIAGSPSSGGVRAASVEPRAHDFAARVSSYSGLELPAELPPLEAVDRPAWIAANLKSMRPLLGGLTERVGEGTG